MIRTINYLHKYIEEGIAGRAIKYVDAHCSGAWSKMLDDVGARIKKASTEDDVYAADEYAFIKTKDFMDIYFGSPEYVSKLEAEILKMLEVENG